LASIPQLVWEYATRVLTSAGANGVTLAEIEASTVLAKEATLSNLPTATETASAVRTELATELAHLDANVSTRSTLSAGDIPAGLSADEVWSAANRTLTEAAGLTPTQADQLAALPTLATIETSTVLAKQASVEAIKADVEGLVIPSAANNAAAVRSELAIELAHLDADVSTRSTLSAGDIPAGLTAAEVWGHDVEANFSAAELLRLNSAVLVGKVSGAGTAENRFIGVDGTTLRVVSTVDNAGNRTQVVLDSD